MITVIVVRITQKKMKSHRTLSPSQMPWSTTYTLAHQWPSVQQSLEPTIQRRPIHISQRTEK
jgi:hypothetical protein